MTKGIGLALLAVGIALLVFGINSSNSFSSSVSRTFNGKPTDKAVWLIVGGIASVVVGGVMTFLPSRKS